MSKPNQKEERLPLRLDPSQKTVIAMAANALETTMSDFVRTSAVEAARRVLGDQVHFSLPEEQWRAFCDALDAPPKDIPQLRKLLNEPSLFDGS